MITITGKEERELGYSPSDLPDGLRKYKKEAQNG